MASVLYLWPRESDLVPELAYPAQRPICCLAWCALPATSDACHGDPFNVGSHRARQGRGSQTLSPPLDGDVFMRARSASASVKFRLLFSQLEFVTLFVGAQSCRYTSAHRGVHRAGTRSLPKSALAQTVLAVPMPVVEYITRACAGAAAPALSTVLVPTLYRRTATPRWPGTPRQHHEHAAPAPAVVAAPAPLAGIHHADLDSRHCISTQW